MKKYLVSVKEINYGWVEIGAHDEKEASDKAAIEIENGNSVWTKSECEIEEVKEQEMRRASQRSRQ
jgi:hypothetical protein